MAIAGYNIYLGGVKQNSSLVTNLSYALSGLNPETSYSVTVSAVDDAGNESAQSAAVDFTTQTSSGTVTPLTPNELTNGYLWFDGTDTANMTLNTNNVNGLSNKITGSSLELTGSGAVYDSTDEVVRFNGVGDSLDAASNVNAMNLEDDFHLFMKFKANAAPTSGFNAFVLNSTGSSNRVGVGIRDGKLSCGYYDGTAWTTKAVDFTDTTSFHVLEFKNKGGVVTAFLDGVEMTIEDAPTTATTHNVFRLGEADIETNWDMRQVSVATGEVTTQRAGHLEWINAA